MSEIKAGDLVRIAKPQPCCNGTANIGRFGVVKQICIALACGGCGQLHPKGSYGADLGYGLVLIERLKKIPPLNELEDQTEERKVEV